MTVLSEINEVIVVDNRSKDETLATSLSFKEQHHLNQVKVLLNQENYGLGGSHKVAIHYAIQNHFNYLCVLHEDDQAEASEVPLLLNEVRRKPELER